MIALPSLAYRCPLLLQATRITSDRHKHQVTFTSLLPHPLLSIYRELTFHQLQPTATSCRQTYGRQTVFSMSTWAMYILSRTTSVPLSIINTALRLACMD